MGTERDFNYEAPQIEVRQFEVECGFASMSGYRDGQPAKFDFDKEEDIIYF